MIDFILGGARSGKSKLAEQRAAESNKQVIYIATAERGDGEMTQRIQHHRQSRPQHWHTVEEAIDLSSPLQANDQAGTIILIDCLTLWVSNLLLKEDEKLFQHQKELFLQQLRCMQYSDVIMVSNETGLGIVPMGELSRRFVDESGWLHQEIAQIASRVTFVVAGLPHILKQ